MDKIKLIRKLEKQLEQADAVIEYYQSFDYYEGGILTTPIIKKWEEQSNKRRAKRKATKLR
jgi:hypothetical protein